MESPTLTLSFKMPEGRNIPCVQHRHKECGGIWRLNLDYGYAHADSTVGTRSSVRGGERPWVPIDQASFRHKDPCSNADHVDRHISHGFTSDGRIASSVRC